MSTANHFEPVQLNGVLFTHEDIARVVDGFYTRVAVDPILKVPFKTVRDWPEHISRMTHFWWMRFGGRPYLFGPYNPVGKHFAAGFNAEFLERWLTLFRATLKSNLRTEQSELWGMVAEHMGAALSMKNELYRREYERWNTESEFGESRPGTQNQGS